MTEEVEGGAQTVGAQSKDLIRYPLPQASFFLAEARVLARNAAGQYIAFTLRHSGKYPATESGAQSSETRGDAIAGTNARIRIVNQGIVVEVLGVAGVTLNWWGWMSLWIIGP